jgi:5-methylcytosine-specific restriction endonuclease McrA
MPKDPNDYQKNRAYYLAREKSQAGKDKRTARQRDRREAIKDGRLDGKSDPREVDHKTPLSKGGGAGKANTRITSQAANRRKYDH